MNKILIDCTSLSRKKTGIENYTEQLCISLKPLLYQKGCKPVFLFSKVKPMWVSENDEYMVYKGRYNIILNIIWIPFQLYRVSPAIALFPAFPPSPLVYLVKVMCGIQLIKIVYDAVLWLYPETLSIKNKLYYKPLETYGIARYDKIVTISASSLKDLVQVFPGSVNKISSIGASLIRKGVATESFQAEAIVRDEFFLFVGTVDTRKNIVVALEAYAEFLQKYPYVKFVIVGRSAWGSKKLREAINKYNLYDKVILTGYIDDAVLNALYKKAIAFVFPSIYEGYGLPVVEAMSHDCPVIASNNSSIPEAAGGAALLVDNFKEPSAWLKSMNDIYSSPKMRENLIVRGRDRIKNMSWNDVAKKMLIIILNVVNGN